MREPGYWRQNWDFFIKGQTTPTKAAKPTLMKTIMTPLVLVFVHRNPVGAAPETSFGIGGTFPTAESFQSLNSVPPFVINWRKKSARKIRMRTYC